MASTKFIKAPKTVVSDGFGGIDRNRPLGGLSAAYMSENFRILPDGSLKKRYGLTGLFDTGDVSSVYIPEDGAASPVYVLSENDVYSLVLASADEPQYIGTDADIDGRATLYGIGGRLMIADGTSQKLFPEDNINAVTVGGYVPLYGKGWDALTFGTVNEPFNLLSDKIRLNYKTGENATARIRFPFSASSVSRIEINGAFLSSSAYTLAENGLYVQSADFTANSSVDIWLTLATPPDRSEIDGCRCVVPVSVGGETRYMFYGNDDNGRVIFVSRDVRAAAFAEAERVFGGIEPLYVTDADAFRTDKNVTAVLQYLGYPLIFCNGGSFTVEYDEAYGLCYSAMSTTEGCDAYDCAAFCDGRPVTLSGGRAVIWEETRDGIALLSPKRISDRIEGLLTSELTEGMIIRENSRDGELWLISRGGTVYVYNYRQNLWYGYSFVCPSAAFGCVRDFYVVSDGVLCLLDSGSSVDTDTDGAQTPIHSVYTGNWDGVSDGYLKKRISGIGVCADTGGEALSVTIAPDSGISRTFNLEGCVTGSPEIFGIRTPSDVFGFLRLTITADGGCSQSIYGISMTVSV